MDKNIKILIVDDSIFMRNVLKNILVTAGYSQFIEGGTGIEAISLIADQKPNLVLLDLIMPEMGGIEVLKQVGKTQKIVVISAVGQDKIIEEAKTLGASGYIIKPFDINQVIHEIEAAMK